MSQNAVNILIWASVWNHFFKGINDTFINISTEKKFIQGDIRIRVIYTLVEAMQEVSLTESWIHKVMWWRTLIHYKLDKKVYRFLR